VRLGLALTLTILVVRLPAFGLVETTLPLPRTRYLHFARFSFLTAFRTVILSTLGTLQALLFGRSALGRIGVTAGSDTGGAGGAVAIRPILLPKNSVNQSAPSGPAAMSDG
jgi:hypothetical protein